MALRSYWHQRLVTSLEEDRLGIPTKEIEYQPGLRVWYHCFSCNRELYEGFVNVGCVEKRADFLREHKTCSDVTTAIYVHKAHTNATHHNILFQEKGLYQIALTEEPTNVDSLDRLPVWT